MVACAPSRSWSGLREYRHGDSKAETPERANPLLERDCPPLAGSGGSHDPVGYG